MPAAKRRPVGPEVFAAAVTQLAAQVEKLAGQIERLARSLDLAEPILEDGFDGSEISATPALEDEWLR